MKLQCVTSVRNTVPFHENFIIFDFLDLKIRTNFSQCTDFSEKSTHVRIILQNRYIYGLFSKIPTD